MASYFWSWWSGTAPRSDDDAPSVSVSTPEETQELIDEAAARAKEPATPDEELRNESAARHASSDDKQDTLAAPLDSLERRPVTQDTLERRPAAQDSLPATQHTIEARRATVSISTPDEDDDTPPAFPSLDSIQRTSRPATQHTLEAPRATVSISTPDADDDIPPDEDDDTPPAFPSLNSIQRTATLIPPVPRNIRAPPAPRGTNALAGSTLMPPPRSTAGSLMPPPSASSLMPPPSTTRAPAAPSKRREKVALAPGHSPLDWAALKASGTDLRGVPTLARISRAELARHRAPDDAWAAFNGRVYNIAPYLAFHPGGARELLRVAGRDGTRLFGLTHAWVNVEVMLDECLVGFLVPE